MKYFSRPSGISLSFFLKRKWEKEEQGKKTQRLQQGPSTSGSDDKEEQPWNKTSKDDNATSSDEQSRSESWQPKLRLNQDQELTRDETYELSKRVFTTAELEERIWKTTTAMFDIQRQIHRGEEIYYEDTYNHGSIYKGWDAFVDMKDVGISSSSGGGVIQTSTNRRVPTDARWFSTSCASVSRTTPPARFPPPLVPQESLLSTTKLSAIPDQQEKEKRSSDYGKTTKPPSLGTSTTNKIAASLPNVPAKNTVTKIESKSETDASSSSSFRTSQRVASSAATIADSTKASTTTKLPTRRLPTPGMKAENPASTRKKRKSTTAASSVEPHPKKAQVKSFEAKGGFKDPAAGNSQKPTATVMTRGSKSEHGSSVIKSEKNQGASPPPASSKLYGDSPGKRETPSKRQNDVETPVPRKRGRPRRKT
ncbi:unnamed protein product [Pseudo-nitzschia multistriata]|uniref:Chromatin modification-related protein EAF6 n=1 Tax=Pseudo-nitzschia multistriata TaxID=183589 RepID=A0A448ZHS0_9STRA|nr:unnamed protein product [Pseudo-nitzschia multistriata]